VTTPRAERSTASADSRHYRELFRHTLSRQILLYFMPLLLLAVFFHLQYRRLLRDSARAHLAVIAEHQATTFDLFLRERLVNLANVIDDPLFAPHASDETFLAARLSTLQQTNEAFADLGVVSATGKLEAYVGPITFPSTVDYHNEGWFQQLLGSDARSVITEIYLGFRGRPHFTIAVKRERGGRLQVLRSTLSPERLAEYLTTLEGAREVHAAVVNASGILQVASPLSSSPLRDSLFTPPRTPIRGFVARDRATGRPDYAYAWLRETPWALVVTDARPGTNARFAAPGNIFAITVAFFALVGVVILLRARQLVGKQLAVERHEAELSGQLVQAAKLASVGELAAGIAHEINNPLAIIAEEVGVLKDAIDPELIEEGDPPLDLPEHLDAIHEAVFRCRDITRKLLGFVRQTEVRLEQQDLHAILDDVLDGMLGNELAISSVVVVREYDSAVHPILTDRNQLVQVFVNLVKNAVDAMQPGGGTLTITTRHADGHVAIAIRDTGCGIAPDQLEQIFMPFYTTKDPGKGTGLGLSVSYTIIKTFGGTVRVDSAPGRGTTFTVELPYETT
jgi:two-component system NtrC family sensor kinase